MTIKAPLTRSYAIRSAALHPAKRDEGAAPFAPFAAPVRHLPIKRLFDVSFSSLSIVVGTPLFFAIALLVKLSSPGPVFYRQERIGRGGRPFKIFKFRTMHPDAEAKLQELLSLHPSLRSEYERHFKLKNDPRITPIGAWLRKTSLDELPQFWNVLKGELSVVGPRARTQEELRQCGTPYTQKILTVRPGLTGIWQTSGRSNTSPDERLHMDMRYVEKRSLALDLLLIAKTLPVMIFAKGAY